MFKQWLAAGIAAMGIVAGAAWAQDTAVGVWRTVDDQTGKPKSLVRITENNGVLNGRVEKLFRGPDEEQNPVCDKCEDERKNQPITGMTIITGMKKDGAASYSGGQILDPANGKVYQSKMTLAENGRKLNVRGFIGVPMLGRTQTWERAD